jgi:hypothetical protein
MSDIVFSDFIVTCHTDGCQNEDIPITISADAENPKIVCGPCAHFITDVTLAK